MKCKSNKYKSPNKKMYLPGGELDPMSLFQQAGASSQYLGNTMASTLPQDTMSGSVGAGYLQGSGQMGVAGGIIGGVSSFLNYNKNKKAQKEQDKILQGQRTMALRPQQDFMTMNDLNQSFPDGGEIKSTVKKYKDRSVLQSYKDPFSGKDFYLVTGSTDNIKRSDVFPVDTYDGDKRIMYGTYTAPRTKGSIAENDYLPTTFRTFDDNTTKAYHPSSNMMRLYMGANPYKDRKSLANYSLLDNPDINPLYTQPTSTVAMKADGGDITEYKGYRHENGGLPLGENVEVESGETRGIKGTPTEDYIFSDRLKPLNSNQTFAQKSKSINRKYSLRPWEKISNDAKEKELTSLMQEHELVRELEDTNNTMKEFKNGGGIHIKPENRGKFNATKARTGKTTEELTHSSNPLTRKRAVFALNASKWRHATGGEGIFGNNGLDTSNLTVLDTDGIRSGKFDSLPLTGVESTVPMGGLRESVVTTDTPVPQEDNIFEKTAQFASRNPELISAGVQGLGLLAKTRYANKLKSNYRPISGVDFVPDTNDEELKAIDTGYRGAEKAAANYTDSGSYLNRMIAIDNAKTNTKAGAMERLRNSNTARKLGVDQFNKGIEQRNEGVRMSEQDALDNIKLGTYDDWNNYLTGVTNTVAKKKAYDDMISIEGAKYPNYEVYKDKWGKLKYRYRNNKD